MIGLKALGYYDPPPQGSRAKPKLVGEFPCAVFATIAADGGTHAIVFTSRQRATVKRTSVSIRMARRATRKNPRSALATI